eukprot:1143406-Pelagomonas_calceolata.AAC.2
MLIVLRVRAGDEGAALLASCLPLLPNLAHLVLTANNLSDAGADALRQGLLSSRRRYVRREEKTLPAKRQLALRTGTKKVCKILFGKHEWLCAMLSCVKC